MSASFPRRVLAGIVDWSPLFFLAAIFFHGSVGPVLVTGWLYVALLLVAALWWFVNLIFIPATKNTSLGLHLFSLYIVRVDDASAPSLGFVRAFLRATLITGVDPIFLLGFVWSYIDARGRMWHDILTGTQVIPQGSAVIIDIPEHGHLPLAFVFVLLGHLLLGGPLYLGLQLYSWTQGLPVGTLANSLGGVQIQKVPADFPSTIVIPEEERVQFIVMTPKQNGKRLNVDLLWRDMQADPVSVVLAYKTGMDLLHYTNRIEYLPTGPRLQFSDPDGTIEGTLTVVPGANAKTIATMVLSVEYPHTTP